MLAEGRCAAERRTMIQRSAAVWKPARRRRGKGCLGGPLEQIQARSLLEQGEPRQGSENPEDLPIIRRTVYLLE